MKKTILITSAVILLSLAPHVFAADGFVALAPIEGLTKSVTADTAGLANFFNNLYKFLIGIAAVLAVIMIIWGGLEYSTQDSVSKKSDGKNRIIQAIFGLILVLSPVLVFSLINPSILNLSINLTKLDTASGPPATTPGQVSAPITTGSGNQCGSINVGGNVGGNCVTTIFTEDTYASPPKGAWCYQLATPDNGKGYNCYRDQNGCRAACRTSCDSYLAPIGCPALPDPTCTANCIVGI